ncbi:MAG: sialidase family protein [Roseiflexaceae bacterium]
MNRSNFWLALVMAIVLVVPLAPTPATPAALAQETLPSRIRQDNVPGVSDTKYPDVLGVGSTAYIATTSGTTSDRRARLVTIAQPYESSSYSDAADLGDADGQSDYSPSVMTVGPDGAIYYIWMRAQSREIKLRRLGPGETSFGPERTIISGGNFRVRVDAVVTSNNTLMVMWDENSRYRYRTSTDGGVTWSGTSIVDDTVDSAGRAYIAADQAGGIWVAYGTSGNRNAGRIRAAYWSGSGFGSIKDLTADKSGDDYFADPSVAVGANNVPYVAWRNVGGGIYYAERDASTGNWNRSRIVSNATAYGTVALASDSLGNLHIAWGGNNSGSFEVWYAFKPAGQAIQGPFQYSNDNDLDANFNVSASLSDYAYGHIVGERFTSGGLRTRYTAVKSLANGCQGTLTINNTSTINGKKVVTPSTSTGVQLSTTITPGSNCTSPQQMQISLGSAPTSKTSPAPVTYSSSAMVGVSDSLVGKQCLFTVYGHLYKDSNSAFNAQNVFFDSVIIEPPGDVDASVEVLNPNMNINTTYTPFAGDSASSAGASGGDPAWTRVPTYRLYIRPDGDCTGLKSYAVGSGSSTNLANETTNVVLGLPDASTTPAGAKTFNISVTDAVGNQRSFSRTINYDPLDDPSVSGVDETGRPVVITATIANDNSSATARKSIIRTISFSGVNVTDNLYRSGSPGTQFWGVWVANGPRNDLNPDPNDLLWVPVEVADPAASFSFSWNLFNNGPGPATDQQGQYVVFVKFLDGAGNPSTATFSTTVTLDAGYSLPTQRLPLVLKP